MTKTDRALAPAAPPAPCVTCGTTVTDRFCGHCGERRLDPAHDFSLRHFVEEAFEGFTHFDTRFLRTFFALMFRPGFLAAEFAAGRRVRYLKPISVFAIAGVVFYLLLPTATAFFANAGDLSRAYAAGPGIGNLFHFDLGAALGRRAAATGTDPEAAWQALVPEAAHRSKAWLFAVAPAWGVLLWALLARRQRWLAPHLVFAVHGLAFFVLFDLAGVLVMKAAGFNRLGDRWVAFVVAVMTLYTIAAVRRAYRLGWLGSVVSGLAGAFGFLLLIQAYRQVITIWTVLTG